MSLLGWPLNVPVLSDGELTLRAHRPEDLPDIVAQGRDPEMTRWTSVPRPYPEAAAEQWALSIVPDGWNKGTSRSWAIEASDAGTPRFAGTIDLRGSGQIVEIGFGLHPWARGQGIMKRAVAIVVDWAMTHGGVEVVQWRATVGNVASLRVAHTCGFRLHTALPTAVAERGQLLDQWVGSFRFGDPPIPRTSWTQSRLTTDRLVLRQFRESDVERVAEACADDVTQYWLPMMPKPYDRTTAFDYIASCHWKAARAERITWAVADRETDILLANLAVMDLDDYHQDGEVGYWAHPDARGKGVMSEALRAAVDYAFSRGGLQRTRLSLYAAAGNDASNAVARAVGFRQFGRQTDGERLGDGTYDDLICYELQAREHT